MRERSGTSYTVSEINARIKKCIEPEFEDIWVSGEVSNYKLHTSGHQYFTIKDESSELQCVIWRTAARGIKTRLKDGIDALFNGDINVYEVRGRYQLVVRWVVERGLGQLELQFRRLKEKLNAEGLFDPDRKRPIPRFPKTIGLVTSETGAAVRDMIHILRRRMPSALIRLYPVKVQGDGAAEEIALAIRGFNRMGGSDVLIVGRGGGSLEDLWAFNEEIVARAIYESEIPVISAVGHEVDFTIADFVADLRAPTPSAAAELAVPDTRELTAQVRDLARRLTSGMAAKVDLAKARFQPLAMSAVFRKPERIFQVHSQRLDEISVLLARSIEQRISDRTRTFELLSEKMKALSPLAVLERGYAVCRKSVDNSVLRSAKDVDAGEEVRVQLASGEIKASVVGRRLD